MTISMQGSGVNSGVKKSLYKQHKSKEKFVKVITNFAPPKSQREYQRRTMGGAHSPTS